MTDAAPRFAPHDIALVVALGLGQIVAYASSFYLLGVLAGPIGRDLGVSSPLIFGAFSVAMLIAGAASAPVGRAIGRFGAKPVLLLSNVAFAVALAAIAAATDPVALVAAILSLGVGMATGLYSTPHAMAVERFGDRARGAITAVSLLGGFGSTVGWFATAAVAQSAGWRIACLGWAGAHLLCLPLVFLLAPPARSPGGTRPDLAPVVWDRRLLQLAILFAGAWFVATCMAAHLPRVLEGSGLTAVAAAATASLLGVAAVSARLAELTALRRVAPIVTTRISTLLHPLGAAALVLLGAPAAPAFVIAQGLGNGVLSVASGTLPLAIYGRENYAARAGLLNTPAKLIQPAGPFLFGVVYEGSGPLALAMTGGVCLLMFAMTFRLGRSG